MTRSPTASCETPSPISVMTPMPSWPRIRPGSTSGTSPFRMCRSVPQIVGHLHDHVGRLLDLRIRDVFPAHLSRALVDECLHGVLLVRRRRLPPRGLRPGGSRGLERHPKPVRARPTVDAGSDLAAHGTPRRRTRTPLRRSRGRSSTGPVGPGQRRGGSMSKAAHAMSTQEAMDPTTIASGVTPSDSPTSASGTSASRSCMPRRPSSSWCCRATSSSGRLDVPRGPAGPRVPNAEPLFDVPRRASPSGLFLALAAIDHLVTATVGPCAPTRTTCAVASTGSGGSSTRSARRS